MRQRTAEPDIALLSEAVQRWYRFYELPPDETASDILCSAALELYQQGHRSLEDIATMLIGTYVGISATRVNAPTSQSVHSTTSFRPVMPPESRSFHEIFLRRVRQRPKSDKLVSKVLAPIEGRSCRWIARDLAQLIVTVPLRSPNCALPALRSVDLPALLALAPFASMELLVMNSCDVRWCYVRRPFGPLYRPWGAVVR